MVWGTKLGMLRVLRFVVAGTAVLAALTVREVDAETKSTDRDLNANHASSSSSAVRGDKTCSVSKQKGRGVDSAIVSRIGAALIEARELRTAYLADNAQQEQIGYDERLKKSLESPDLLHQRCWFEDQLSCTLLGSGLQDLRGSLSKLKESDLKSGSFWRPVEVKRDTLVLEMRRLENDVIDRCRKLPWNLG